MMNQTTFSHLNPKHSQMDSLKPLSMSVRAHAKAPMEHAKDPHIISESTNNTVSPVENAPYEEQFNEDNSQNAVGFYLAQKYSNNSKVQQQENSNTKFISRQDKKTDKIKVAIDEAPTNKISNHLMAAIKANIQKEVAPNNTSRKLSQTSKLSIPYNPAAQKIIEGKSLRQRFSNLLQDQQKYSIGHDHRRLLRILKNIDTTIEFATMSKNIRSYFFYELRGNLRDNLRMEISRKELGQLLFIDGQLFKVEWAMNYSIHKYDLLITIPQIKSQDQRQAQARKAIVDYLFAKEVEFLASKQHLKKVVDGWSAGFDPNHYEIPEKELPIHPEVRDTEIRAMEREKIDKIENNHIRQLFKQKKDESEARSMCSKDVQKMIFSKKSNAEIEEKLLAAVRQRQAKLVKIDLNKVPIDNSMTKMICQEIMIQYMGRNVSNIPKATLIDALNKKFSTLKIQSIILALNIILEATEIGFLKEITTMSKTLIYQISKEKFKDMLSYLQRKKIQ